MLSRLASQCMLDKILLSRQLQFCAISTSSKNFEADKKDAESSQRDLVNFPRFVRPEYAPPVRFGFIPESWFQFFYPKTGVTGPYVFGATIFTYLMSKEILVVEHNFTHAMAVIILCTTVHMKFGDKIAEIYNKAFSDAEKSINESQEKEMNDIEDSIKKLEGMRYPGEFIDEITKAKKENILLQMESIYRQRLIDVHKKVKSNLDYLVALQNVEQKAVQKNLVDYVVRKVLTSITPDLEQTAMQKCISDLNSLSAKV